MKERETVRDYFERMEIGEIMLHPDNGSTQSLLPVAHLLDLLPYTMICCHARSAGLNTTTKCSTFGSTT
jgi:hypothetical protein